MTGVEPKSEKEESISQTVYSLPKDQYIKTQISRHATQLKLPNSTDIEKTKALQNIIHLLFGFNLSLFHEIVTQSIAIEEVYKLMLRTKNPNIRTLCGALLQVVQQRGTETEKKADWRTLLSPIVSFLFNTDELISELGKQALIDALEKQPESLQALIELDLIEHATEELNRFYISQQSSSSSSSYSQLVLTDSILNSASQQFSIFDPNKDLPIGILANIMKVVIRMLQKGNINDIKTAELRYVAEQLSHKQLTQQFEAFCKEILRLTEKSTKLANISEYFDKQSKKTIDIELLNQDKQIIINKEQQQNSKVIIDDSQQQIRIALEQQRLADQKLKMAEDKAQQMEQRLKEMESHFEVEQQRNIKLSQLLQDLQTKHTESQQLLDEVNKNLHPQIQDQIQSTLNPLNQDKSTLNPLNQDKSTLNPLNQDKSTLNPVIEIDSFSSPQRSEMVQTTPDVKINSLNGNKNKNLNKTISYDNTHHSLPQLQTTNSINKQNQEMNQQIPHTTNKILKKQTDQIQVQSQTSQKNMNNNVLQPPEHSIPKMKLLTVAEEAAKHFICELSNTIMTDPVSIDGLHYFERNALVEYIQNQGISHVTYEATTVNDIKEEPALKAELERYLRDNPTRLSKK